MSADGGMVEDNRIELFAVRNPIQQRDQPPPDTSREQQLALLLDAVGDEDDTVT